jgi:hypothetical protein
MNKSFVIAGPDATEAEGRQLMQALKVSHRQYDFELYEPYGTNTNYGIMMASWVSKQRAAEALQAAKQIERTSFIWNAPPQRRGGRENRLAPSLTVDLARQPAGALIE